MKKVFISYASADRAIAQRTYDALTSIGINCWMAPQSIPAGADYTSEIPKGIDQCQAFVLILSENAQKSKWVKKEVNFAINEKKLIYVIKIDDSELDLSFKFSFTDIQINNYTDNVEMLAKKLDGMVESISDENGQDYGHAQTSMSEEQYLNIINSETDNINENKSTDKKTVRRRKTDKIFSLVCIVIMFVCVVVMIANLIDSFSWDDNLSSASETVQNSGQTSFMLNSISFTGTYTGDTNKYGRADGLGQFIGKSEENTEASYIGDFKEGLITGNGTAKINYTDGRILEITGEFKNGLPDGKCSVRSVKSDGEEYCFEGYYSKSYANGEGVRTVTKVNGDVHTYEGMFKNGNPEGMVRETVVCANGDKKVFYGEFYNNSWNGKITVSVEFADGGKETFEGTCVNGKYEGEAVWIYERTDGTVKTYNGEFSDNKRNGQGTEKNTYADGTYIEINGEFSDDKAVDNTPYTKYDADGNVIETGVMIDDMPVKQ